MHTAIAALIFWTALQSSGVVSFTGDLWAGNRDIYEAILKHPFLRELADGTLKRESFVFYMAQDAQYLTDFARALDITAAKSPKPEWAALLSEHAAETLRHERSLHEGVFADYGITAEQLERMEPSPEAFGYTSYLLATAYSRPFSESISALLPCYWIYWEVGKELKKGGSKNPEYQKWIDSYSSEEYAKSVRSILEIVNETARSSGTEERLRMRRLFRRSARYEWMFWDSAYNRRTWPPQ